ncbi:ETX/MTX2 family pore-forming toxin [Actinoplanes sp. NPDC051346]|uniref:ETX/MTX2 family pore-forming toxin n=1 Tax=Actinoplanes sp. NPDC051346 TaxID=3155048 RepID=UPI003428F0C1
MFLRRSAAAMGAILTGCGMVLAMVQPAAAEPNCDVPEPPPICGGGGGGGGGTTHAPKLFIDLAQQDTSQSSVHVQGWTADPDGPTTALTVHVKVDGNEVNAVNATVHRPDVAAAYPRFGAAHGFDVWVPASPGQHTICVLAVGVGTGGNTERCAAMDGIVQFEAHDIAYDMDHAVLTEMSLEQLDKVTNRNDTAVQQSTEISGSKTTTDTETWSNTKSVKVTVSTSIKVGFPIFADGKVTVSAEGSYSGTDGGSVQRARSFSWRQPVLVPARSIVEATVTVAHAKVAVPYTLSGEYIYGSGARAAGTIGGTFKGGNSENLTVVLRQYNLNGTPAAAPVRQPKATLLRVR